MPAKPPKTSTRQPMKWTAEADRDLLLLLVQMYVTKIDYQEVAKRMGVASVAAVERHIQRIRKSASAKGITGARIVKREPLDVKGGEDEAIKMEVM